MNQFRNGRITDAPASPPGHRREEPSSVGRFAHIAFRGRRVALEVPFPWREKPSPRPRAGLCREEVAPGQETPEARLIEQVVGSISLEREQYRLTPLVRRIPACLRALRTDSIEAAISLLDRHPKLMPRALDALLIGTTGFFRDEAVFNALENTFVPALAAERWHPRVWSAACSDGSELYSAAMMFALCGVRGRGRFLGTDCRASVLEKARRGLCSDAALSGLREPYRSMFVAAGREGREISSELRSGIEWKAGDVLRDEVQGEWDLIFCRNLAIYLHPEAAECLWAKLASALATGGILVVGKAEKPRVSCLRKAGPSIYRKIQISSAKG